MDSFASFRSWLEKYAETARMPALFVGHGSPMNAIEQNEFSMNWQKLNRELPRPTAILCISAHWETRGTYLTAMAHPSTIHDFYGFPKALFDVEYPAPGSNTLVKDTIEAIQTVKVEEDMSWGLDHGCWSVLKHLYPAADVPVVQMSINQLQPPEWHYQLARELNVLRKKGVLILGSGNMVHNLRIMDWHRPTQGFDWAVEANNRMKEFIQTGNHASLTQYQQQGAAFQYAIPTPEHYLPLLYLLGLKQDADEVHFFNDKTIYGSISMTSLIIG